MASPVRVKKHGKPHARMMGFLSNYQMLTKGLDLLDNTTLIVNEFHEPQPDCALRIEENLGGKNSRLQFNSLIYEQKFDDDSTKKNKNK